MKHQDKTSEKELNGKEISNLSDKEFKVIAINMLTELGRRMDELSKYFNKGTENIKKKSEQKKTTEMKNTL